MYEYENETFIQFSTKYLYPILSEIIPIIRYV